MPRHPSLFTIGYEQATQGAFLDALGEVEIGLLVDVRAVAASRRPGFSKRQLAAGADERGIDYLHLRGLGTPADGRTAARAGRHAEMRRIFEAELETDRAKGEMAELMEIVRSGRRVCLVCYERDAAHCHRSIVAERVCEALGIGVEHLVPVPGI